MLDFITGRLRLFLRSELDMQKDRLLQELKGDKVWYRAEERKRFERSLASMAERRGFTIEQVSRPFILEECIRLERLVSSVGAKLEILEDGRLEVRIGQAAFVPATAQEIRILLEIFEEEVYLIESRTPFYVWDIGANVATASIYFATVHGWDTSAYELFPPTAKAARANIERSGLAERIELNAFGLGAKSETLTLRYNEASRGSNGIFGNTDPDATGDDVAIDVNVLDAAEAFVNVQQKAASRPILAKLDCEGAEYAIVPRLIESGAIDHITAIVMEEHVIQGQDREKLAGSIRDAGFIVRRTRKVDDHVSLLFACRLGN